MEPFADECTQIFLDAMRSLQDNPNPDPDPIDLGAWLQWYAFDVIGAISFQRRFGFMEERRDVLGMIGSIDAVLKYAALAGQVPGVHAWLMGSRLVGKFLAAQPFVDVPDPLRTIVEVCSLYFSLFFFFSRVPWNSRISL
jgi:hypothetical protein